MIVRQSTPVAARRREPARAEPRREATVEVRDATTLEDFMQAMPLLRQLAREENAPIAPDRVGTTLARLNFGGSGRDTGALVLAREAGALVGFALLRVRPYGLELTWLHVDTPANDAAVDGLLDRVAEIATAWSVETVRVGYFAHLPTANDSYH